MQNSNTNSLQLSVEKTRWQNLAQDILQEAHKQGASQAEVAISNNEGFSINVRLGEVETVEYNRNKGIDVTVYIGKSKGSASTSDISTDSIKNTVIAACNIARLTSPDPYAGLADATLMAHGYPELQLYHPWAIEPEQAIQIAQDCEQQAREADKRISNSEGASVNTHQGIYTYGNSHGFIGCYTTSRHSISCALVAQDKSGMQRDYSYTTARDANDLDSVTAIARETAERTVKRLGAKKIKTCQAPVIFHADIASSIIGNFLAAISGGNLYRKASFLVDHLGKSVFTNHIHIYEHPHLIKALGSAPFDAEGVITKDRELVVDGILQGYLLSSYSARKLGMQTTGNAGGSHNVHVETSNYPLPELLKQMQHGLLVTELMGQGVNLVTGDYSRGAVGFWIENGEIQHPVEEITIAGNLQSMFQQIVAIGNDIDKRHSILTGSIWIEKMMIAGE